MDFRVGGVWRYTMHGPDGTDYPNHVTYTGIEKPSRIAYDHGTNAQHPSEFKAVISFEPGRSRGEKSAADDRRRAASATTMSNSAPSKAAGKRWNGLPRILPIKPTEKFAD